MATFGTQFFSLKCYHFHLFTTFVMLKTNKWIEMKRRRRLFLHDTLCAVLQGAAIGGFPSAYQQQYGPGPVTHAQIVYHVNQPVVQAIQSQQQFPVPYGQNTGYGYWNPSNDVQLYIIIAIATGQRDQLNEWLFGRMAEIRAHGRHVTTVCYIAVDF